jgi:hypothetical protein
MKVIYLKSILVLILTSTVSCKMNSFGNKILGLGSSGNESTNKMTIEETNNGQIFQNINGKILTIGGSCNSEVVSISGDFPMTAACDKVTSKWQANINTRQLKSGLNNLTVSSTSLEGINLILNKNFYVYKVMDYGARKKTPSNLSNPNDAAAFDQAQVAASLTSPSYILFTSPDINESSDEYWPRYHTNNVYTFTNVHLIGEGLDTEIHARDHINAAIVLKGENISLRNMKLTVDMSSNPPRNSYHTSIRVLLNEAKNFHLDRLKIESGSSAGILIEFSGNPDSKKYSVVSNSEVSDTRADTYHVTQNTHYVWFHHNKAKRGGDDGIAVVSYKGSDPANVTPRSSNILIEDNDISDNSINGRGITVVGGDDIIIRRNTIANTAQAGIYFSSESFYNTHGAKNILVENNTVQNACVGACVTGHASISVFGREDHFIENVTIQNNTVSGSTAYGAFGIQVGVKNLVFKENNIHDVLTGLVFRYDPSLSLSFPSNQKSSEILIENNSFKNMSGSAFVVSNAYTGLVRFKNNVVENINTSNCIGCGVFQFSTADLPLPEGDFEFINNLIIYKNSINFFDTCVPGRTAATCYRLNNDIREN